MKIVAEFFPGKATEESIQRQVEAVIKSAVAAHAHVRLEKDLGLERHYTARQLSVEVGFPPGFWRKAMRDRLLPVVQVGKIWTVAENDVRDFLRRYKLTRKPVSVLEIPAALARQRFQNGGGTK